MQSAMWEPVCLNEIMSVKQLHMQQPPSDKGKRLQTLLYYTGMAVKPPTFVIFVNDKELMHFSYTRYIENQIRRSFRIQRNAPTGLLSVRAK